MSQEPAPHPGIHPAASGKDARSGPRQHRPAGERPRIRSRFARGPQRPDPDHAPTSKLQKRLAEAGLGSRRAMEELIQAGQVSVNGLVARVGTRVGPEDRITVAGEPLSDRRAQRAQREPRVVLYHKPEGEIVSRRDPEGRTSVFDRVPIVQRGRWLAVGRLDFNTCGLLVFTDSGELANRLTHPRYRQVRDYAVRIVGELTPEQMRSLRSGVTLEDGPARFELLEAQGGEGTNRWYRVRVREGRNRLVRRLFAAVGMTVSRLMRTRFGPFELPPRLKRGQWLRLEAEEVQRALQQLEDRMPGGPQRAAAKRPAPIDAARKSQARFKGAHVAPAAASGSARTPHRPRRRGRAT
jgi:23S rRNA pseudouridine2605 synthase